MNKIKAFVIFCAYVLAALGGLGYLLMIHQWVIAGALVVLAALGWPVFVRAWNALNS